MSNNLKSLIKNIVLIFFSVIMAYLLSLYFGVIYDFFFPKSIGNGGLFSISHESGVYLIGIPLSFIFFLTLLFTAFGGEKKYWWIGILLIPSVAFELYFDFSHIYFPITLGVIGWVTGLLISKILSKIPKTNTSV